MLKNFWVFLENMWSYEKFRMHFGWVWWRGDESSLSLLPWQRVTSPRPHDENELAPRARLSHR